jgi:heme oxygenase
VGLVPAGGNYKVAHNLISRPGLSTSHLTGAGCNVGVRYKSFGQKAKSEEIPVENYLYALTHGLRGLLLKEGLKRHRC